MKTITIPLKQYECLRGHLQAANDLFESLAGNEGNARERKSLKPAPKETKPEKIKKYDTLIGSGARVVKPNHLKR